MKKLLLIAALALPMAPAFADARRLSQPEPVEHRGGCRVRRLAPARFQIAPKTKCGSGRVWEPGLPAMQAPWSFSQTEVMLSQASQLPH